MGHQETDKAAISDGPHAIFQFTYRSIPFRVLFDANDASTTSILKGELGTVPFTGDGEDRRSNTLAVIDATRRIPGYQVKVRPNHTIGLSVRLPDTDETTPDAILAAAIEKLAGAKKLLDLMLSFQPSHLRSGAQS